MSSSPYQESPNEFAKPSALLCFTELVVEPEQHVKDKISCYFNDFGSHSSYWLKTKYGKWYAVVEFDPDVDCQNCLGRSRKEKIFVAGLVVTICPPSPNLKRSYHASETPSPYGKALKECPLVNLATPASENPNSLNATDRLSLRILSSMREYGYRKKGINLDQFAVILVLPEREYDRVLSDSKLLTESLLNNYARTAVPSSHVPSLDHCEELDKVVVHAEAKLIGAPKRHPPHLAVPYDRSCLVQIITNHRKLEWENGISVDDMTKSFKMFLYSKLAICDHCTDAIFDSIFCNLVEKTFWSSDKFRPVVGHGFARPEEDVSAWLDRRVQFFGPRPGRGPIADAVGAVKRDLTTDMKNIASATTPLNIRNGMGPAPTSGGTV